MKGISHSMLHGILNDLEPLAVASSMLGFPSKQAIRPLQQGSHIQVYGLDRFPAWDNRELPIVVAIGGNYTQAKARVPRDNRPPARPLVEDDLGTCRTNVVKGFDHYHEHQMDWFNNCAVSSPTIDTPKDSEFHLVMTNLCLWITRNSWQNIGPAVRADLLENNPRFDGQSTAPGLWAHFVTLAGSLKDHRVIWVGHGIHSEVFALFRQFMRSLSEPDWLLMPNLAYYYDYDAWNLLKGCTDGSYT